MYKKWKMIKRKLKELIKKGESERVELKPSLSQINEIIKTISAFSNTRGGIILIGVSKSGKILGVEIGKDTIERLTNKIQSNTDQTIYPKISVETIDNKKIILIKVEKAIDKPILAFGRAFKRVGKSTLKVDKDEHERMVLEKKKIYFDSLVCEGAKSEDIDWDFIKGFFVPKYESITKTRLTGNPKNLLESLGAIKNNRPTNAGILLFGKDSQKFFMNAYVALARYKEGIGTERLDYKEFTGNLFQQIDRSDKYIKEHIAIMSRLHPMKVEREDIPEYPLFSIRELITNAVCHRDYSEQGSKVIIKMFNDHIEFYNPGGLAKDITPRNITQKQFSKNPVIAKVLSKIRYIEELGEGWDKIIKEHKKHPLKPKLPKITSDKSSMFVILFSTKEKFEEKKERIILNERQKKAVDYIKEKGEVTRREYEQICRISKRTAIRDLNDLVIKGIIKERGKGPSLYYTLI